MADKDLIETLAELFVLALLIKPFFDISIAMGIGFLLTIAGAIYNGSMFTKHGMFRFITGGTILTYAAGQIFLVGIKSGELISTIIIFVIAAMVWIRGFLFKKGVEI